MTSTSNAIIKLLSYSKTDYAVTGAEENKIIQLIRADINFGASLYELHKQGFISKLFDRVDSENNSEILVQTIAGKLASSAYPLGIESVKKYTHLKELFDISYHLQHFMKSNGLSFSSAMISRESMQKLLAGLPKSNPAAPFTGSGATGGNIASHSLSIKDKINLKLEDSATLSKYSNPIPGSLSDYLQGLTKDQRKSQALILLQQKIHSVFPYSYQGQIPSRADILKTAGLKFKLEPALIAAFVLAEQRDQSRNEDAKDYTAAISMFQANTSIGLGQIVISTARNNDLFSDLLPKGASKSLNHNFMALLLTSDEFNIVGVAKYIRMVADIGSKLNISSLPQTKNSFPGLEFKKYSDHSSRWPNDNIRALASEYTSRAWDDRLSEGWAFFVFEAYQDIKAAGVI